MTNEMTRSFLLVVLAFLSLAPAFAASAQTQADAIKTAPLDELRDSLMKDHRSKKAAKLGKAWNSLENGSFQASKKAALPLWDDPDFGDDARWISAQSDLGAASALIGKKRFQDAVTAARSAQTALEPLALKFPYSPWIKPLPQALALIDATLGRGSCEAKKWALCRSQYESAFERWMSSNEMSRIGPDDLAAYSLACSKKPTELCRAWALRLLEYYPSATMEYKTVAAFFPEYENGIPRPSASGRITQSYRAPDLDQAAIDAAIAIYLDGKNKEAADAFQKFLDEYPRSIARYRARYWLGEALKKLGKSEESSKTLAELAKTAPLTYYGLLAGLELHQFPKDALSKDVPTGADKDRFLYPDELFHLKRAQNFLAEKAEELAGAELREIRPRTSLSNEFLGYLAMLDAQAGVYSPAFSILTELYARGDEEALSVFFLDLIFPTGDFPEIKKISEDESLDPLLMTSLIKQESAFNPEALSSSGAIGMMQLMPLTAAETVADQPRRALFEKDKNIETGTLYFSGLSSRFLGNWVYAIGGYNAGPTAMNRWMKASPPKRPMLEFIESIPYKETREYICSIIRNYFWYTEKLTPVTGLFTPSSLDVFWQNPGLQPEMQPAPGASAIASPSPEPSPSPSASPSPFGIPSPRFE